MSCEVSSKDGELIEEGIVMVQFLEMVHFHLDTDDFSPAAFDWFMECKISLNQLQRQVTGYTKSHILRKAIAVARHTGALDPAMIHESLRKFEAYVNTL